MNRKAVVVETEQELPAQVETIDSEQVEAEMQLHNVLATLGASDGGVRIMLYRTGRNGEKDSFLKQFSTQEWLGYDLAGVLADYGGGDFRVRVYDAQTKLRKNVPIRIEEPRNGIKKPEMLPPPPNNGPDILAAIGQMTQAMLAGFQTLARELAPKQESRQDLLKEMAMMRDILAPAQAAPQINPMEVFLKGVDFARSIIPANKDGETTGNDVFLELVRQFGPALGQAAARMTDGASVPRLETAPAPARQITTEPAAPATGPAPNVPTPEQEEMNIRMMTAVKFLNDQAAADNPVETYAEMVADNVPPELLQQFASQETETLLQYLTQFNSDVPKHAEWYGRLHTAIKQLLTEDDGSGTTDPLEPGAST